MIVTYWFKSTNRVRSYAVCNNEVHKYCFAGEARAILTPLMSVTTVHVYKEDTTAKMAPGDVYIGIKNNKVICYEFYMGDSLLFLALKELIRQHLMHDEVRRSVRAFLEIPETLPTSV
jgi:hypothetical protein